MSQSHTQPLPQTDHPKRFIDQLHDAVEANKTTQQQLLIAASALVMVLANGLKRDAVVDGVEILKHLFCVLKENQVASLSNPETRHILQDRINVVINKLSIEFGLPADEIDGQRPRSEGPVRASQTPSGTEQADHDAPPVLDDGPIPSGFTEASWKRHRKLQNLRIKRRQHAIATLCRKSSSFADRAPGLNRQASGLRHDLVPHTRPVACDRDKQELCFLQTSVPAANAALPANCENHRWCFAVWSNVPSAMPLPPQLTVTRLVDPASCEMFAETMSPGSGISHLQAGFFALQSPESVGIETASIPAGLISQ